MTHLRTRPVAVTLLVACFVLAIARNAVTQDRMPPIPQDQMTEAQRAAIEEFKAARNRPGISGPFVPLARSPTVCCHRG